VQLSGVNADQSEVRERLAGTQDRILGVITSLLMQMKLVGKLPPCSSAHKRLAKQMDTTELAQLSDWARRCAARPLTTKATDAATTASEQIIIVVRTRMRRRAATNDSAHRWRPSVAPESPEGAPGPLFGGAPGSVRHSMVSGS